MTVDAIHEYLTRSAARTPEAIAIEELDGRSLTYGELDRLTDRFASALRHAGVMRGDRVGFCLPKSADAIAAIYGILKAGAAYVPVDPNAPASRNAFILRDCAVRALLVDQAHLDALTAELEATGPLPELFLLPSVGGGAGLEAALDSRGRADGPHGPVPPAEAVTPDDIAYILYTSGSTGRPKGVTLTHGNGISFTDWCTEIFAPTGADRFSLFPPLQFDMSTSDLFLSIKHGARIVPIDDRTGKDPFTLGKVIQDHGLSMWYSVPSVLSLMAQHGRLERYDLSSLRVVLFAGEVFPVTHLRRLRGLLPGVRMFNLYGPTETNVCTYFEIPNQIPEERTEPYPIGRACSHARSRVIGADGAEVEPGAEGELCIAGAGVMSGYWNMPERTEGAFLAADGLDWYRTGDVVREEDGELVFLGRRDRMVKRRGYRIELGEIEAALYRHPSFSELAVLALTDDSGTRIQAAYGTKDGEPISLIELKAFAAEALPLYMVPDRFVHIEALPRTATGKTDYQRLKELV
jgi:amino acid adenylation domain-containing protein